MVVPHKCMNNCYSHYSILSEFTLQTDWVCKIMKQIMFFIANEWMGSSVTWKMRLDLTFSVFTCSVIISMYAFLRVSECSPQINKRRRRSSTGQHRVQEKVHLKRRQINPYHLSITVKLSLSNVSIATFARQHQYKEHIVLPNIIFHLNTHLTESIRKCFSKEDCFCHLTKLFITESLR